MKKYIRWIDKYYSSHDERDVGIAYNTTTEDTNLTLVISANRRHTIKNVALNSLEICVFVWGDDDDEGERFPIHIKKIKANYGKIDLREILTSVDYQVDDLDDSSYKSIKRWFGSSSDNDSNLDIYSGGVLEEGHNSDYMSDCAPEDKCYAARLKFCPGRLVIGNQSIYDVYYDTKVKDKNYKSIISLLKKVNNISIPEELKAMHKLLMTGDEYRLFWQGGRIISCGSSVIVSFELEDYRNRFMLSFPKESSSAETDKFYSYLFGMFKLNSSEEIENFFAKVKLLGIEIIRNW